MKLQGHDLTQTSVEIVILPRGIDAKTGEKIPDIVFRCQTVRNYDEFDTLCKQPNPPEVIKPGGVKETNLKDETFLQSLNKHNTLRYHYMVIKSLAATPGLVWDTIKPNEPKSWENWQEELSDCGFSQLEIAKVIEGVMAANALSQKRIDEALANFQLGQVEE